MSDKNPNTCDFGAFDLEKLLLKLIAVDGSGNVGLKMEFLTETDCNNLTEILECASHLTLEQALRQAIGVDACGGLVLRVFNLT